MHAPRRHASVVVQQLPDLYVQQCIMMHSVFIVFGGSDSRVIKRDAVCQPSSSFELNEDECIIFPEIDLSCSSD